MKKRVVSFILVIVMVLGLLPVIGGTAQADGYTNTSGVLAEGDTPHRIHWTLYGDRTLYLRKSDQYAYLDVGDDTWERVIIDKDNDINKTGGAVKNLVKALVVEEGIERIPERMFEGYPDLISVTLPGLRYIESNAFCDCKDLESVAVGGSVEKIGASAFKNDRKLSTFTVNGTVGSIEEDAFSHSKDKLGDLYAFNALITGDIGRDAFYGQNNLYVVSPIRGSVGVGAFEWTKLAEGGNLFIVSGHSGKLENAFNYHSKSKSSYVHICYTGTKEEFEKRYVNNSGVPSENIIYQRLGKDVSWELSDGVLYISGVGATIDLLKSVEQPWLNIPGRTWDENREQIAKVVVQSSVQLGEHMLDGLEDRVEYLHDHDGTLGDLAWLLDEGTLIVSGKGAIPDMGDRDDIAWMPYRNEIREIIIENGVTAVGYEAFAECTELTSVSFPDSVTQIEDRAFFNCTKLDNVSLPKSLRTIEAHVFGRCTGLKQIYIPQSVDLIDIFAFAGAALTDIYYEGTMNEWNMLGRNSVKGATIHPSSHGLAPMIGDGYVGPKTGDTGRMRLWIALMCLSGAAMVSMMIFGDKRKAKSR